MENETKEAVDTLVIDPAEMQRMVQEATAQIVEEESEARKPIDLGVGEQKAEPRVTGERVPQYERRTFRALHGLIKTQSSDWAEKQRGNEMIAEYIRQERSITAWQKDEEDELVAGLFADSGLSRRVQTRLHSTLTGPAGEFALPKPFLAELFVYIEEYGLARRLARTVNMGSKDIDLKGIATKPSATWTNEGNLMTESDLAMNENVLTTKKLGAVTSLTKEQDEDAFVALLPTWLELLAESIAEKEDEAWLIGDGTSTYGTFTGIANMSSVQTNTLGSGDLNFSDVVEADFRTTRELLSTVRRRGARWIMHRGLWNRIEQFESSVGARIVQSMLTEEAPKRFLGFPVEISEAMVDATSDVANVDFAILGNFNRSLIGVRRGITVESTDTGVLSNSSGNITYNAFQADGILVKISTRVGFQTPTAMQDGFAVMNAPAS